MNKYKTSVSLFFFIILLFSFVMSCDHGQIGGADISYNYIPGDEIFEERMAFFNGVWYSYYAGRQLDSYRIHKWEDLITNDEYMESIEDAFPDFFSPSPVTYVSNLTPGNDDYILRYGGSYIGLVRGINIFNEDLGRGAIIIEYFEATPDRLLSGSKDEMRSSKPFFGIYFRVIGNDTVQMANSIDTAAMRERKPYYTEQASLLEAFDKFTVENEAEFITWGVVYPQVREK